MCYMRISRGLEPACAKACPTGALDFGNERFILKLAAERLEKARSKSGDDASLIYPDEVRAIYLVAADPAMYHEYAAY
jgi:formate dehydrogenase iron-sulfur subunit